MSKYQSATHVTYNIGYHVVFCPKYRYGLLQYRAADVLKRLLTVKASDLGITIQAMEVMPDHVHLFVQGLPSLSIDRIVKQLKGYTSYHLRKQFNYLHRYPTLYISWKPSAIFRKRPWCNT